MYNVPVNTDGDTPFGSFAGKPLTLSYYGFGELHDIPFEDKCVSKDVSSCNETTPVHVAKFVIPDGAEVTVGSETKYVKTLTEDIYFALLNPTETSASETITIGQVGELPAKMSLTGNDPTDPFNSNNPLYPGPIKPALFDAPPKVIQGEVQ